MRAYETVASYLGCDCDKYHNSTNKRCAIHYLLKTYRCFRQHERSIILLEIGVNKGFKTSLALLGNRGTLCHMFWQYTMLNSK